MPGLPRPWLDALRLRTGLLAAVLVLATLLAVSALAYRPGGADPVDRPTATAWRALGVDPLQYDFGDLRSVTHRWPCARLGQNSYLDGQCDPWKRLFNYPRVWLAPARLGWGPEMTRPLAFLEIELAFLALWTLFPARTVRQSLFVAGLVLSTPVMFAVERGNIDLLVFAALVLGLRATRDLSDRTRDAARTVLFAGLAFLKLFPIAAFVTLARSPKRLVWAAAGLCVTAGAIALLYRGDLALLQANTMHEFDSNYGRLALFAADPAADAWRSPHAVTSLVYVALIGGLGATVGFLRRGAITGAMGDILDGAYKSDLAAAALAIFALTFLIGLNYDYRLIFLLPVCPLLLQRDGDRWSTAPAGVAVLLLVRFLFAHRLPAFWLGVFDWAVFGGAVAWFTASATPRFLPFDAPRAVGRLRTGAETA